MQAITGFKLRLASGILSLSFAGSAIAAGPSTDDPNAPLPVGPLSTSQAPYVNAVKGYEKVEKAVREILETHSKNGKGNIKAIGAAFTLCAHSSRLNRLLTIWGEPAGAELELRNQEWLQKLKEVRDEVRKQPAVAKKRLGEMQALANRCQQLEKQVIPKAQKLAEQGKFAEAAVALYAAIDEIEERVVSQASVPDALRKPFFDMLTSVENKALTPIREKAKAAILEASLAEIPDMAGISKQAHDAAAALAMSERVNVNDQSMTGPELVTWIGASWKRAELATLRARAGYWRSSQNDQGTTPDPRAVSLDDEFRTFAAGMLEVCVNAIQSDATRAAAPDVPKLYGDYLIALTPIIELGDEPAMTSVLVPALDKLAGKSPELDAQVKLYRRATRDALRWRERLAASQAQARSGDYPALADYMAANAVRKGDVPGLIQPMFSQPPSFWDSAPRIIEGIKEKFVGQKVSVREMYKSGNEPTTSTHTNRTYAQISRGTDLASAIGALKVDLFAAQGGVPFTLEAAAAIDSAERGCLTRAGGTIERFELEAVTTRFSMLTDADWGYVRLGDLAKEQMEKAPLNQATMRVNLMPEWLCHRYFFVEIPSQ